MSFHVTSCHFRCHSTFPHCHSYHDTHFLSFLPFHAISCHLYHLLYFMAFTLFHVISCHFMSFHVISCHFMSFHVISCHFMCHWTFPHCHSIKLGREGQGQICLRCQAEGKNLPPGAWCTVHGKHLTLDRDFY
jgi:hypothetical protein